MEQLKHTYDAACQAALFGQTGFLEELLHWPMGEEGLLNIVACRAAKHGNLAWLCRAHELGFDQHLSTAAHAAAGGRSTLN
jgi:hypothetical protein